MGMIDFTAPVDTGDAGDDSTDPNSSIPGTDVGKNPDPNSTPAGTNGRGMSGFNGFNNNGNNMSGPTIINPAMLGSFGGPDDDDEDAAKSYLIDYNEKYKQAGPTLFRDSLVRQTMSVLISKDKPNAILVGPAGTGKTKIVEDIAYRIANNDALVPDQLKGFTIYELPLSNIVAGSGIVGEIERKLKCVINFLSDKKNKTILFIDEIHMLMGDSQVYNKIAQIMKPALARGDIRVIGATTTQEYKDLMDDPAFNRRFSKLIVDELTREQTVEILSQYWGKLVQHYGNKITINPDLFQSVVHIADQYSQAGSHRPDNALTLLDRACGEAIVTRNAQEVAAKDDPALMQAFAAMPQIPITDKQVRATAIKLMTGQAKREKLDFDLLDERFAEIKGQNEAIEIITKRLKSRDKGLFPSKKPTTMLFAGASGVGKTAVSKIVAEVLTGVKPIMLNMTEYNDPASINRIIGSPAGYVGSDSKSELPFDILESNPYQVILLDEIEKCDKSVQRLFMSAFEEGYIKTSRGSTVDFSKAIIFATTNASHTTGAKNSSMGFIDQPTTKADTTGALSHWFDVEFLNRFEEIITFNDLDKDTYRNIVAAKYEAEAKRINDENRRINLPETLTETELDELVEESYVPAFGARPAEKIVRKHIESIA